MAVRLPRGNISGLRSPGGRLLQADLSRLRRRVAAGKPITLYRGKRVKSTRIGRGMRRVRTVRRDQSWALTPHLALEYAGQVDRKKGSAGLLYSITVPASEMRGVLRAKRQKMFYEYETPGDNLPHRGKWTAMQDPGAYLSPSKRAIRLELRPNQDRPDLKPKIVGTVTRIEDAVKGSDLIQTLRYGFTRRLRRRRGGAPARGGGA